MYKLIIESGEVIRVEDNVVVSPCQSVDDPNYVEYLNWIYAGNQPDQISDPTVTSKVVDSKAFREQFTDEEIVRVIALADSGDTVCKLMLFKLQTQTEVDERLPIVVQFMNYLVSKNVITASRKDQILS